MLRLLVQIFDSSEETKGDLLSFEFNFLVLTDVDDLLNWIELVLFQNYFDEILSSDDILGLELPILISLLIDAELIVLIKILDKDQSSC